ncbi:MAG: hypothetical protein KDD14_14095 [Saprospiraceae bacterium]|nr:hypothetical protein [Saprospiraceae bacterium]
MESLNSNGSPPPLTPPEQDDQFFFQTEESAFSYEDQPEVKIYLISHAKGDPNYYKRLGFYCALDTVQDPNDKFLELLEEQKNFIHERRSGLERYYFAKEERYGKRVREAENKINDEKVKLIGHVAELTSYNSKAQQFEQEVCDEEKALTEAMTALGKRKENLIEDAIMAIRRQMEALIENYQKVYADRYKINERTFEDNRPALEIKVEKFKQLRAAAENQWNRIVQKMLGLQLDGVNPFIARWLFYLGIGIATVCGAYFFSIFALSKELNDENISFFFLSGLLFFIQNLFPSDLGIGWRFFYLFAGLASLILIISGISFFCWKLLGKANLPEANTTSTSEQKFDFEAGAEGKLALELQARSTNFYQFWLQVIPIVVIAGIALFVVFLGLQFQNENSAEALRRLDISLTGATIGALLTLMVAGISYLYIIKIVELRADNDEGPQPGYYINIELIITALFFVGATFSLFLLQAKENQQIILIEYLALVLSNGFLLGYALRIKGLFSTQRFLENRILTLSNAIRDNSRPRTLNFTSQEDRNFRKAYFKIQKELFHLMLLKTQLGNTALGGQNANKDVQKALKKRGWRWWQRPFNLRRQRPVIADARLADADLLTEWEARLYPENHAEIREITEKLKRARARFQETAEQITLLKEERTPYCTALKDNIRRLEDSLDGIKRAWEKILFHKARELTALHTLSDSIQADIREGYNLGVWFRSEVGPSPGPGNGNGNGGFDAVAEIITPVDPEPTEPISGDHNEQPNTFDK